MNRHLAWKVFQLLLVALVATVLCFGCGRQKPKGGKTPAATERPAKLKIEAQFKGAKIIWNDEQGRTLWEAEFKEAKAFRGDETQVKLLGVKANLYQDGKIASTLIAPDIAADSRTKEVRAIGGVKIISAIAKTSANVSQIIWKAREGKIIGIGEVKVYRGNLRAYAKSFNADTGLTKLVLQSAEVSLE
ncbi:MAG: hypothetical protein K6T99_05110 [Armatimonadetes bacterium]|nr:hypothetical protein [Armatimonadota bacterium]